MSRNLGRTNCRICYARVVLEEEPRLITQGEAGCYFPEYAAMLVANAHCYECGAKYLAWVDLPSGGGHFRRNAHDDREFVDLSFRSTFNDEPGESDMPEYIVDRVVRHERRGPWPRCPTCGQKRSTRDASRPCWKCTGRS